MWWSITVPAAGAQGKGTARVCRDEMFPALLM